MSSTKGKATTEAKEGKEEKRRTKKQEKSEEKKAEVVEVEEEEGMEEGEDAEKKGGGEGEGKDEGEKKEKEKVPYVIQSAEVEKGKDALKYDLGNLEAYEPVHIEKTALGTTKDSAEAYLRALARDNTQLLINSLFGLASEPGPGGVGRLITLPAATARVPREKPVPKLKARTKWEQFAAEKGILKKKKSRLVMDEMTGELAPRWGYKKANDASAVWAVESKEGEDVSVDPWSQMDRDKKERVAKNKKNQLGNIKAAMGARVPGQIDLTTTHESKKGKRKQEGKQKKERSHVDVALGISQKSTASMGVHDKARESEPTIKPDRVSRSNEGDLSRSVAAEKKQSLSVLSKILGKETTEKDSFKPEKALHAAAGAEAKESRPGRKKGQGKGLK